VDSSGKISTIAGTGSSGYSGDGGPANKAQLAAPYSLAVDSANNIYIADVGNSNIRVVTSDGNIRTFVSGVSTDSIATDKAGNIYFADSFTHTVRKILPNGTQYIIAGIPGSPGFSGDGGLATTAQLNEPHGVAVDSSGNVYVADSANQVIRLLTPASPSISVASAASGNGISISPGEVVNIFGTGGLGPSTPVSGAPVNGFYAKALGGTTVTFNNTSAVVFYTSATQVSAIVPYSMPIGAAANVTVSFGGQSFTTANALPITAALPGIFTSNSTGIGQVAAINQNNTINSHSNPAPEGTIISLYVTGEGLTTPAGVDGKITTNPFPTPVMGVQVTMKGQSVPVSYAGEAPGLVAGVMQVNALIPKHLLSQATTLPVDVPVVVQVGTVCSQANATISVVQ
jgi:trimeric autotransporter adhesin